MATFIGLKLNKTVKEVDQKAKKGKAKEVDQKVEKK